MPKIEKVGSGMTERERVMYDVTGQTPGDITAARDAFRATTTAINEMGLWRARTDQTIEHCEAILADVLEPIEGYESESVEWYAKQIRKLLKVAGGHVEAGHTENAAKLAFDAGILLATANLTLQFNGKVKSRQRSDAGLTKAAAERRDKISTGDSDPVWWHDLLTDAQEIRRKNSKYKRQSIAKKLVELPDRQYPGWKSVERRLRKIGFP